MTQTKTLPKELTSYDFFKTAAVVLMIIDHIGYYFFPETEAWWRVFGRMCVPIWFFLIGYANSRDMGKKLWIGGGILLLANVVSGLFLLPLNILFTVLVCRQVLDRIMQISMLRVNNIAATTFVLFMLILPTAFLFEYGTQAILIAMFGWMVRHQKEARRLHKDSIEVFLAVNIMIFIGTQALFLGFNDQQTFVLGVGSFFVFGLVWLFKPKTYPELTKKLPGFIVAILQFGGRRTLEIYVAHLVLFKALGMALFPERFEFLNWQLFVF